MKDTNCIREKQYCISLFEHMREGFIHGKIIYNKNIPEDCIIIDMNKSFEKLINMKKEQVISKRASQVFERLDNRLLNVFSEVSIKLSNKKLQYYGEKSKKHYKIVAFSDVKGEFYALFVDITDSIKVIKYKEMYSQLLYNSIFAIFLINEKGIIVDANNASEKLYGYTKAELIGKNVYEIRSTEERKNFKYQFETAIKEGIVFETFHQKKDGTIVPVEVTSNSADMDGEQLVMSVIKDISERKRFQENLEYMANHDFLTNIANRAALINKFSYMLGYAKRNNEKLAVLFFDVDKFKSINDNYGHDSGDKVLKEVANRINNIIREIDAFGRMGGDEFVIIQAKVKDLSSVNLFIRKIMNAFNEPIVVNGIDILINTSIGVSIFPDDETDMEALINFSDNAMYVAKRIIGNSFRLYSEVKDELKK